MCLRHLSEGDKSFKRSSKSFTYVLIPAQMINYSEEIRDSKEIVKIIISSGHKRQSLTIDSGEPPPS